MLDNNNSKPNESTKSFHEELYNTTDNFDEPVLACTHEFIILNIMIVTTLATLIYGVVSWCIVKKFRNYRNFVFLNGILSNFTFYLLFLVYEYSINENNVMAEVFLQYLATSKSHWLVVISHMFYVDIVIVFNTQILRKYLKSTLFGWGVSLITTAIFVVVNINFYVFDRDDSLLYMEIMRFVLVGDRILPLIVNCFFYFRIVFSLCRSFIKRAHTTSDIWRGLYIASLIFILSDVLLLSDYVVDILFYQNRIAKLVVTLLTYFNPLVLDVYFVGLRSNREMWCNYYVKKLRQRL